MKLLVSGLVFWGLSVSIALAGNNCDDLSAISETPYVDFTSQIQPIFDSRCSGCHTNGGNSGGLMLDSGVAYHALLNAPATDGTTQKDRVEPGDAEQSFLFEKLNCANPVGGTRMPLGGSLSLTDQALFRDWINQGALAVAATPPVIVPVNHAFWLALLIAAIIGFSIRAIRTSTPTA